MVSDPMPVMLSRSPDMTEIMWNFSRFKDGRRLTLKDNPHFYERLPTSAEEYGSQFRTDPIQTFHHDKISVLTDSPLATGRVFFETAQKAMAFVNVWVPKDAIIFKGSYLSVFLFSPPNILLDVRGRLEGESIIGSAIKNTPNLWCYEEPPLSNASWLSLPDRSSPSSTTTATPTTSPTGALLGDWREPILRMLRSQGVNTNIHILDKSPSARLH